MFPFLFMYILHCLEVISFDENIHFESVLLNSRQSFCRLNTTFLFHIQLTGNVFVPPDFDKNILLFLSVQVLCSYLNV